MSFPTSDGGVVYADHRGDGSHLVIFVHGGQFAKESWTEQASWLAQRGYRTLALDMRGRGRSHGGPGAEADADLWYLDVMAAASFAKDLGAEKISVVGASWGGWAAAEAARRLPEGAIDNLVLMAASSVDRPEEIRGRKLFIMTRDDFMGGGTLRLPAIQDQFDRSPPPKELVILDGSAHAQHVFQTEQGPEMWAEIVRFLGAG